jgi:hypothetical protein
MTNEGASKSGSRESQLVSGLRATGIVGKLVKFRFLGNTYMRVIMTTAVAMTAEVV